MEIVILSGASRSLIARGAVEGPAFARSAGTSSYHVRSGPRRSIVDTP